jgi:hypothetical protein
MPPIPLEIVPSKPDPGVGGRFFLAAEVFEERVVWDEAIERKLADDDEGRAPSAEVEGVIDDTSDPEEGVEVLFFCNSRRDCSNHCIDFSLSLILD